MTYKEFKQGVEELGLVYTHYKNGVQVYSPDIHELIVFMSIGAQYSFSIIPDFILSNDINDKLLDLCCEMARTPVDERGELE